MSGSWKFVELRYLLINLGLWQWFPPLSIRSGACPRTFRIWMLRPLAIIISFVPAIAARSGRQSLLHDDMAGGFQEIYCRGYDRHIANGSGSRPMQQSGRRTIPGRQESGELCYIRILESFSYSYSMILKVGNFFGGYACLGNTCRSDFRMLLCRRLLSGYYFGGLFVKLFFPIHAAKV